MIEGEDFTSMLSGIPPEVHEYHLCNSSTLHWVIDEYQISTDKRRMIVSDPNRDGNPEFIVRLVRQMVKARLEKVQIVNGMPAEYTLVG